MKKIVGAATATLLTVVALAGCGGSSGDSSDSTASYCGDVKAATTELSGLDSTSNFTSEKFTALTGAVHNIAGEAPSDVKASWTLIDTQFAYLKQALDDAGVSIDDFGKLAAGQTPPGLDTAKLAGLTAKLQKFDTAGLSTASTKIQNQVKSDCNIDLNSLSN